MSQKPSYTKRIGINTIVQLIGKIITTATSLILVAKLTRYLGVEGYGIYTTIFAYVSFAAVIADFGFFWILVREMSKPQNDYKAIFNNVITLKIIFSIIVFFIASIIGFYIPQYSWSIKIGITIISISWFWMTLNSTYVGLFQSKLEMYKAVISDVVGRLIILLGVLIFISKGYGLETILLVYIIGNFFNFALSMLFGSKHIKFRPKFDKSMWIFILKDSFPLAILSFTGIINGRIDAIILSIQKTQFDVGIYGVPYKILEIVILLPGIFMGNVFPLFTKYYYKKDIRLNDAIQKAFNFLVLMGMPVVVGLIMLSDKIIEFIGGKEYVSASTIQLFGIDFAAPQILMILSLSIGVTFVVSIFSSLLTVAGKQFKQVIPMATVTMLNLVLNLIFIPKYTYVAAAITTVISEIIMVIWWYYLAKKYINFKISYNNIYKVFLCTLIMGLTIYITKSYNLFVVIVLAIIVYFVFAYLIKLIDKQLIMQFLPKKIESRDDSKQ